ncbi:hypothetical protein A1O3_06164 [Capronia epimyces CBS 606.96]|uniref:F-box domain-containing protein n=1 Tax=Capronia epimyces CBS 606.96 TaxID=1182542 RepID=W9XZI3_9EURO|nr:uncharacterized protein A1O3_06164 [Capronia epimyces CBS 606.96]EXJ82351.1 hypothetical protein A1O3_06164 [Capronia epimyces CBS 606.96]
MNALRSLKDRISSRLRRIVCLSPPPPSVQVQARRISTLERLPVELLLCIVSFLPTSSVACLSLTSKWHHEALLNQFDPKWRDDDTEKARFLRLLEEDVPEMMVCCFCNILYRWKKSSRYLPYRCPNCYDYKRHDYTSTRDAPWCYIHKPYIIGPFLIYRNMVDAFLRGFAKGPRYGPQLEELNHTSKPEVVAPFLEGVCINKTIDARVVKGKLLLHSIHTLSVSLLAQPSSPLTSRLDLSQFVSDRLLPALYKFDHEARCSHTMNRVGAAILYAGRLRLGYYGDRTRSLDLLSCGRCATDLRVRVELDGGGTHVQIEVETWQSLGGRDSDNRDKAEDAHFSYPRLSDESFDINHPPVRNLEKFQRRS